MRWRAAKIGRRMMSNAAQFCKEGKPDEGQEHAGIGWMTHDAKRSSLDQHMVLFDCYIHGEKPPLAR